MSRVKTDVIEADVFAHSLLDGAFTKVEYIEEEEPSDAHCTASRRKLYTMQKGKQAGKTNLTTAIDDMCQRELQDSFQEAIDTAIRNYMAANPPEPKVVERVVVKEVPVRRKPAVQKPHFPKCSHCGRPNDSMYNCICKKCDAISGAW